MPRIAIVGPGSIGGVITALLHKTRRHDLAVCVRRPLTELVVSIPGEVVVTIRPTVFTEPRAARPVDWVLVATKAYDASTAAAWFEFLCTEHTSIAILQNGVEHRERFAGFARAASLVPVVVDLPAERTAPNAMRQRGAARMTVADDARGRDFAALFSGSSAEITLTPDLKSAAWRKLCLNSVGVISALVMQPAGVMRAERISDLARGIMRECIAVGRAEGAMLDDSLVEIILQTYREAPPDSINSLHGDRLAGRPTEIDARNGVIVRLGRKHGIATPLNEMAVTLVETMSASPTGAH